MAGIAVIVPVLRRPHRVAEVMASVFAATTVPRRLLFVASPGDDAEIAELTRCGADFIVADQPPGPGDYARKINAGYRATSEPYIFTGADDLRFHPGWDTAALAGFAEGIGVVGTNDLGNPRVLKGQHSTHSLVSRAYADTFGVIDSPGAIYCEEYWHEFVDDELVATAKHRKAWAFAKDCVVEHLHPFWGKAQSDEIYEAEPERITHGRAVLNRRKHLWGAGPPPVPISVIVATYGDEAWKELAAQRAVPSVTAQKIQPAECIVVHGANLADARNQGAKRAKSEWLCFLDADDELHPRFVAAMSRALGPKRGLLNPAVQFVTNGRAKPARMLRQKDLSTGNYLVIGTLIRADLFWAAGGFDPQWEAYEDWCLFRRLVALSGSVTPVGQAVYRAHWSATGRNNTIPDKDGLWKRIDADFAAWEASRS